MPTLVNLRSKQIADTAACPRCRSGEEDISHVFLYCLDFPKEHSQTRSIDLLWHMGPVGVKKQAHALYTATRAIQIKTSFGMTIHFDAAFNRRDFKSMAGLVVLDHMRVILATKTVLNSNISTSFATEAYAGLHAINLGLSMGIHSVTVKGDSRTVIKKCQTSMQDKSVIGAIISDIQKKSRVFSRNQIPIYQ
ncbi:uncharacterized protein [Gossypium hirsutum]|uniref:RNase H type-1 domain-containing protein n=1 Tax=Gossypium hirsutum TaxID=3635 RepID=A0ABM2Z6F2_GOSHI|nr:uncharacterized protein LOC121210790 [Gossypium hirsutum]